MNIDSSRPREVNRIYVLLGDEGIFDGLKKDDFATQDLIQDPTRFRAYVHVKLETNEVNEPTWEVIEDHIEAKKKFKLDPPTKRDDQGLELSFHKSLLKLYKEPELVIAVQDQQGNFRNNRWGTNVIKESNAKVLVNVTGDVVEQTNF